MEKALNLAKEEASRKPNIPEGSTFILWNKAPLKIAECLFVEEKLYSFGVDKENSLPSFSW